jgi:hypothetical protein
MQSVQFIGTISICKDKKKITDVVEVIKGATH